MGGQPKLLYPFKKIYDIPVFDEINGADLIKRLKKTAKDKTTFIVDHRVTSIKKIDDYFVIDDKFKVKSIIIATGAGSFEPKKFPVKSTKEVAKRIHYFIKKPGEFANQTIGVFGGGDSALDWSLELAEQKNTKVKLIHRRNEFRGLESTVQKLKSLKNVEIRTPYLPLSVTLRNNQLYIELKQMGKANVIKEQFDQIIVAYGFRAERNIAANWGIELNKNQIKVSRQMETNVPGIYAVGDAAGYDARVPIIGLGFGEAQIAVTSIMRSLFPEKTLIIHSTSI